MSNLRIDNIAPSAGGTYRNAPRGIAAAWVNFNGTGTPAIRDSENVGSITDNGTGDYTLNFTNAFGAASYSFSGGSGTPSVQFTLVSIRAAAPTTTAIRIGTYTVGGGVFDEAYVSVEMNGDLA
jgi:hypothetical protein